VFLLVIIVALIVGIAVVKSQKKGNVIISVIYQLHCDSKHYSKSEETYLSVGKGEDPYYSVVNIKRADAIEMKQNHAYEKPPQLPLCVEENPAYGISIQKS